LLYDGFVTLALRAKAAEPREVCYVRLAP
jgi:hypothetical protein